ncbi:DNA-binding protein [Desulfococcaceae bacterium HSG7]|nr:DNA-binding protein [Desulfococcaceae bacterium HSG7]
MKNDLFIPEWFENWFSSLFLRKAYSPTFIIVKLNIKKDRVYRAIASSELEAIKIGGRWLVPTPAIKNWLLDGYILNLDEKD